MLFIVGRVNPLQTTRSGSKLYSQKRFFQKNGVISDLNNKKQNIRGRGNVNPTQKQVFKAMAEQPKVDDKVDANQIVRGQGVSVVVGGGPAGLAAALMLAKQGFNNIIVLEALSEEDYFDSSRSYTYGVNYRGQTCLQKLNVLERVMEVGVDQSKTQTVFILPNGTTQTIPSMYSNPNILTSYLVQRQEISKILLKKIQNDFKNSITYYFNAKCIGFKKQINQQFTLTYQIKDENPISISPYLVVGADGKNSFIRKSLHEITNQKKFKLIQKPVFGTGTIAKSIKVPQYFYIDNNKQQLAQNNNRYYINGISEDEKNTVQIVSWSPTQILTQKKSRNFLLDFDVEDHNLLKISNKEEYFKFLEKQLPQLPIRDIITLEEADNFIFKRGVKFPQGGYSQNLSYIVQEQKNNNQFKNNNICKGVILVGDAIHHFPPSIGQGVNAALEDICVLYDLFQKYNNNNNNNYNINNNSKFDYDLESIMHEYENNRIIDSKALIQLTQQNFAGPQTNWYKYGLLVKNFLHQKNPKIFPPPAVNFLFKSDLRYSEILKLINYANLLYNFYIFMVLNVGLFGIVYLYRYFVQ